MQSKVDTNCPVICAVLLEKKPSELLMLNDILSVKRERERKTEAVNVDILCSN